MFIQRLGCLHLACLKKRGIFWAVYGKRGYKEENNKWGIWSLWGSWWR